MRGAIAPLLDELIAALAPALAKAQQRAAADDDHYTPDDVARVYASGIETIDRVLSADDTEAAQLLHELAERFREATIRKLASQGRLHAPIPPGAPTGDGTPER